MKIVDLVRIVPGCLYAIRFEGIDENEYDLAFDRWEDIEYLFHFFAGNEADLATVFYDFCSLEEAVKRTLIEAAEFDEKVFRVAGAGSSISLGRLFKPLVLHAKRGINWEESKAYGPAPKSWLRLYAVRASLDVYVITGGTIKLTRKMEERQHTRRELEKLKIAAQFLRDNGFETDDDFVYVVFD